MIEALFGSLRALGDGWRAEAARRRRISATDPVADTLEHCAGELHAHVHELDGDTVWLGPEGYAELHHVTAQTVRNWIRHGELDATRTAAGAWRIRRAAERKRHLRSVA